MRKNSKKYTVLIVDDMPINIQILTEFLKSEYSIKIATSGKKALEIVSSKNQPDLILLDIVMPESNGFEICRKLKSNNNTKEIPVIFITVLASVEDKIKGFAVGGADYVTKPFQQEEVMARVRTHLKIRQQNKQLQQQALELTEARNIAEKASKAKSIFLANMSHELRSPLNTILGFAQLLNNSETLSAEHRKNAAIINQSGEYLLNLINNVLDMSKIEAGKAVLNEQEFNLKNLIDKIIAMFIPQAKQKNILLLSEIDDKLPGCIKTDEIKLRQVLINLLSNAVKFTEKGYVKVYVGIKNNNLSEENLRVQILVEDTGSGINQDELDDLFEPFVQTKTGKAYTEGTGLGLPISKQFIKLMGGNISVKNKLDNGTIFKFDIKCKPANSDKNPKVLNKVIVINQPDYKHNDPIDNNHIKRVKKLPKQLIIELKNASEETDLEAANQIIQLINQKDKVLGNTLKKLVNNFRFDILQQLFEETA